MLQRMQTNQRAFVWGSYLLVFDPGSLQSFRNVPGFHSQLCHPYTGNRNLESLNWWHVEYFGFSHVWSWLFRKRMISNWCDSFEIWGISESISALNVSCSISSAVFGACGLRNGDAIVYLCCNRFGDLWSRGLLVGAKLGGKWAARKKC